MKWNAALYKNEHSYVSEYGKELLKYVNLHTGQKILDIGCGTGELAYELSKSGAEVTGIDSSPHMIESAKKRYPEITFKVEDALNLAFDNDFDTVFSNAVFHWIKEAKLLLKNVHKALKQGGKLVCEFGACGNVSLIRNSLKKAFESFGHQYNEPFYFPEKEEYRNLLEKENFSVELLEIFDRMTPLKDGKLGIRNFIEQFFSEELGKMEKSVQEKLFRTVEKDLKPALYDGKIWTADYKRIRVIAKKQKDRT